jgi:uncharacterized protein (DUF952 family)
MAIVAHITARTDWEKAQMAGAYEGDTLETEGFIHLCMPYQLLDIAKRNYDRQEGLVVMVIDTERVRSPLRYEPADGDHYPHLYGPLNMDAVLQVIDFSPNENGEFEMPDRLANAE